MVALDFKTSRRHSPWRIATSARSVFGFSRSRSRAEARHSPDYTMGVRENSVDSRFGETTAAMADALRGGPASVADQLIHLVGPRPPLPPISEISRINMWRCCKCEHNGMPVDRDNACLLCGHGKCATCTIFQPNYEADRSNRFADERHQGDTWSSPSTSSQPLYIPLARREGEARELQMAFAAKGGRVEEVEEPRDELSLDEMRAILKRGKSVGH